MDWVHSTGTRFVPIDDPPDAAELVARGLAIAAYPETALIRIHAPIEQTSRGISPTIAVLEAGDDGTTIARIGGDADWIARYLAGLEWPFDLLEPEAVRTELHALGRRLQDR
jgi:hypothetical protein